MFKFQSWLLSINKLYFSQRSTVHTVFNLPSQKNTLTVHYTCWSNQSLLERRWSQTVSDRAEPVLSPIFIPVFGIGLILSKTETFIYSCICKNNFFFLKKLLYFFPNHFNSIMIRMKGKINRVLLFEYYNVILKDNLWYSQIYVWHCLRRSVDMAQMEISESNEFVLVRFSFATEDIVNLDS